MRKRLTILLTECLTHCDFILGSKLVMIVDAPVDFQWDEAMARLATLPRQAEWEAFVSKFQGCPADARSDEKWQPMERMFRLY